MNDYKQEIEQSRIGSLGSSDATVVLAAAKGVEQLSDTDKYRLAVLKGQAENVNFTSSAIELGDRIEATIFDIIKQKFPQAVSNPKHEDEQMSKFYGFGIINHIDVEVETDDRIIWYEIKASKKSTGDVLDTYAAQLQWHWMLLRKVYGYGKTEKKLELNLVHYRTEQTKEFSAANIHIVTIGENHDMQSNFYAGFMALKNFLPTFEYTKPEEMSIRLVDSEPVQSLREAAEIAIIQIKKMEEQIDNFKAALKEYMIENNIKKIYSDNYSCTLTAASTSETFDSKRFKAEQPELYSQYIRETKRAASVTIKVKEL